MSIQHVLTTMATGEEIWAPLVTCDHCLQQITGYGNVLWDPNASPAAPLFAHKGHCNLALEDAHPAFLYWEELRRWLQHLTNNSVTPGHRVRPVTHH